MKGNIRDGLKVCRWESTIKQGVERESNLSIAEKEVM